MGIFDLDRLQYVKADSLEQLAARKYPFWDYIAIMRREGTQGILSIKIKNRKGRTPLNIGFEFAKEHKQKFN